MFGILFLLFTAIPALELYLLFQVGDLIGGFETIMLIVFTGIVGASLAKTQGLMILHKIQSEVEQGGVPANQLIHGLLVFGGGLLLLTPGFMTDALGFAMVIPGTRHLFTGMLKKGFANGNIKFQSFSTGGFQRTYRTGPTPFEQQKPRVGEQVQPNVFEADFKKKD